MIIYDEKDQLVNTDLFEKDEQLFAQLYIKKEDCVLELGARYGSVSCVIDKILENKEKLVVVEPDPKVWDVLEKNKKINDCNFHIIKGFVSNKKWNIDNPNAGYSTSCVPDNKSSIPSFTLNQIEENYNLRFNVLFADCEGFLETFLDENPQLLNQLRLIIFEKDSPNKCNYNKIMKNLKNKNFRQIVDGFHTVWIKDNNLSLLKHNKTSKNKNKQKNKNKMKNKMKNKIKNKHN